MKKRSDIEKRGISPLIATVLIIGFTVVLAVLVINWALPFIRNLQESTEESSNIQIICAQSVNFNVKDACISSSLYYSYRVRVTASNDANKDIDKFVARFFKSESDVVQRELTFPSGGNGLNSFDIESQDVSLGNIGLGSSIKKVELIPIVTVSGKEVTCSTNVRGFGEIDGNALEAC